MKQLTPREVEVLNLISGGSTAIDIAKGLGISKRTIDAHTNTIKIKLQANNITHAVRIGIEQGYVVLSSESVNTMYAISRLAEGFEVAIDEHEDREKNDKL